MKQLTQAVFEGAPDWVKSAAPDENGRLFGYDYKSYWLDYEEDAGYWFSRLDDGCRYLLICKDFYVPDWRIKIDREVAK